jgi:ribose 5-phosphate isomerase A
LKEAVAKKISERVKSGELIGVGSGSTVTLALSFIGERVAKEKLSIRVLPTSYEVEKLCAAARLQIVSEVNVHKLDWAFDGADEVDEEGNLIKGKGGALLREKIVAEYTDHLVVIVDQSKLVKRLGERCALPIETVPRAEILVTDRLKELGARNISLREAGSGKKGPVITEAGNVILDAKFDFLNRELVESVKSIIGVVEHGAFFGKTKEVLVGYPDGRVECHQLR